MNVKPVSNILNRLATSNLGKSSNLTTSDQVLLTGVSAATTHQLNTIRDSGLNLSTLRATVKGIVQKKRNSAPKEKEKEEVRRSGKQDLARKDKAGELYGRKSSSPHPGVQEIAISSTTGIALPGKGETREPASGQALGEATRNQNGTDSKDSPSQQTGTRIDLKI